MRDPESLTSRIEEWRVERERRLEAAKRLKELEELRECSFAPKVWLVVGCRPLFSYPCHHFKNRTMHDVMMLMQCVQCLAFVLRMVLLCVCRAA